MNLDRVRDILRRCRKQRILVVGDLMLDRYIHGSVSRISPEAPVPVVHVDRERAVPGGSSNVALNLRALGGGASVCGVIGRDDAGTELTSILKQNGIRTAGVTVLQDIPTIVKSRVLADRQQIVRIDWEKSWSFNRASRAAFARKVDAEVRKCSGVIIEDYGKGVVQQFVVDTVLKAARRKRIPVGLDPKDNERLRVGGITVATPNRKEAFVGAGRDETRPEANPLKDKALLEVGRILLKRWKPDFLAITLGPHGMLLVSDKEKPRHVPTRAREVYDVSGAGDTVIATCVLALASGADHVEAAEIANYAAGVVVGKLGTATCTQEELIAYIASMV